MTLERLRERRVELLVVLRVDLVSISTGIMSCSRRLSIREELLVLRLFFFGDFLGVSFTTAELERSGRLFVVLFLVCC